MKDDCPEPDPALAVTEGILPLADPLRLHFGGELEGARLAWRLVGPPGAPVVLAMGGISAHRSVAAEDGGWWAPLIGSGRAVCTARYRVLGIDYLGGSGASTGPTRGATDFPTLSARDQADAIVALLDALDIARLHAVVGASYGGMVALSLGERHPTRVERLVVISAAERAHPLSAAWRSIEREIVRFGIARGDGTGGLKLARALAMTTYRTPREFKERFQGEATLSDGRWRLPVEDYVYARGDAYVAVHVPEAFVCLSESIDLHAVDASTIPTPTLAIAVREDQLVPLADVEALVERLPNGRLAILESRYGHDAFLKEGLEFLPLLSSFLAGPAR
jgi:homoserine O-acetyltransferase